MLNIADIDLIYRFGNLEKKMLETNKINAIDGEIAWMNKQNSKNTRK